MTTVAMFFSRSALVVALLAASLPASAHGESRPAACTAPSSEPAMLSKIPAEMPAIAEAEGLTGHAVVRIELDRNGFAHNASIVATTGSAVLDSAALAAAVEQRFAPAVRDCESIDGRYAVEVDFTN